MEQNELYSYEAPVTTVLELKAEGMVCLSPGVEDYIENEEQDWI